jgi:hypothetical protein
VFSTHIGADTSHCVRLDGSVVHLRQAIYLLESTRCRCTGAPTHADAGAGADARAALPPGGASKRKHGRPRVAKRGCPAGKAGRASEHGPGTYVYNEVQAACDSGLYTCGAVLTPAGHALDPAIYCNIALTCKAPVESTLNNMSASAMK